MSNYIYERAVQKEIVVDDLSPEIKGRFVLKYYKDGTVIAKSLYSKKAEYITEWGNS